MRQYGLIGYPLSHSFSQKYFTEKFLNESITDAEFLNFPLPDASGIHSIFLQHPHLLGLSVTIPHKRNVIPWLDDVSDVVKAIGACNCIKVRTGKKTGFNTDVTGFERSFMESLQPHHTRALILGTGGAASAVEYVLKKKGISYSFVSRTLGERKITYQELDKDAIESSGIIINCTPLGTFPNTNDAPAIPYEFLTPEHYLFDLVYNPPLTQFLLRGQKHGCTVKNGYEMLVQQAEESWKIWNG